MNIPKPCSSIFSTKFLALKKISEILRLSTTSINSQQSHKIGILGVGLSKGQKTNAGVEYGPEAIRSTNFIHTLEEELGYHVSDYGDIIAQPTTKETIVKNVRNPEIVGHVCEKVSLKVQEILRTGDPVLALGGDHSISLGTVHGHALIQPDICVISVGAHADINTSTTTKSYNMNGMVYSFHLHELEPYKVSLPGFEWLKSTISAKDIVYIGLRDVDPLERLIFERFGITFFSMQDVDKFGIVEVTKKALDAVNPRRNRPIHICFDVDAYDINVAPSTSIGYPGGLSLREGLQFAEEISKTGLLTGLDIVEVNTKLGQSIDKEKTLYAIRQTILAFCGNNRGGNLPLNLKDIPLALQIAI